MEYIDIFCVISDVVEIVVFFDVLLVFVGIINEIEFEGYDCDIMDLIVNQYEFIVVVVVCNLYIVVINLFGFLVIVYFFMDKVLCFF